MSRVGPPTIGIGIPEIGGGAASVINAGALAVAGKLSYGCAWRCLMLWSSVEELVCDGVTLRISYAFAVISLPLTSYSTLSPFKNKNPLDTQPW